MALKDLRSVLFNELNNLLQPHGFKWLKSKNQLVQKTSYGCNVISLTFLISYAPKFIAEVRLYNEIDYLGNILKQFDDRSLRAKNPTQFIFTAYIGDVLGYPPNYEYDNLRTEKDFFNAAHAIYNDMVKAGFEHFSMPTDAITLDQIVNSDPYAKLPLLFSIFYSDFRRYCIAITLAKLVNRANFEELVTIYRNLLQKSNRDIPNIVIPYYDNLVTYLRNTDIDTLRNLK